METYEAWAFAWQEDRNDHGVGPTSPPLVSSQVPAVLTFSAEDSPAKTSQSPDADRGSQGRNQNCSGGSSDGLALFSHDGSSWKTSRVFFPPIEGKTLPSSFRPWPTSGFRTSRGEWSTPSASEYPKDADGCSLWAVLELENVPRKYYLSPKACRGVLRRAERRGKALPEPLARALAEVAQQT